MVNSWDTVPFLVGLGAAITAAAVITTVRQPAMMLTNPFFIVLPPVLLCFIEYLQYQFLQFALIDVVLIMKKAFLLRSFHDYVILIRGELIIHKHFREISYFVH